MSNPTTADDIGDRCVSAVLWAGMRCDYARLQRYYNIELDGFVTWSEHKAGTPLHALNAAINAAIEAQARKP